MKETKFKIVKIYAIKRDGDSFYLDAYINPDTSCLVLSGQDFSKTALEWFGDDEYEYFYTFSPKDVEKLKKALYNDDVLTAIKDFFHNEMLNTEFFDFCKKHRIKYDVHVI